MTPTRYEHRQHDMQPHVIGNYVKWEDYETLLDKYDAIRDNANVAKVERLELKIDELMAGIEEAQGNLERLTY